MAETTGFTAIQKCLVKQTKYFAEHLSSFLISDGIAYGGDKAGAVGRWSYRTRRGRFQSSENHSCINVRPA